MQIYIIGQGQATSQNMENELGPDGSQQHSQLGSICGDFPSFESSASTSFQGAEEIS